MKKFRLKRPDTHKDVFVLVDDEDAFRLRSEPWKILARKNNKLALIRTINGEIIYFNRCILGITSRATSVLFKNNNELDFQRNNLVIKHRHEALYMASLMTPTSLSRVLGICINGHQMTEGNYYQDNTGGRKCKICQAVQRNRKKEII